MRTYEGDLKFKAAQQRATALQRKSPAVAEDDGGGDGSRRGKEGAGMSAIIPGGWPHRTFTQVGEGGGHVRKSLLSKDGFMTSVIKVKEDEEVGKGGGRVS